MLNRLSIRTRLIALAVVLLALGVGTDLYLTRALRRASDAALNVAHRATPA